MMRASWTHLRALLGVCLYLCVACRTEPEPRAALRDAGSDVSDASFDATLRPRPEPSGPPGLCARDADDAVRDVFCGAVQPQIRGIDDLRALFEILAPRDPYAETAPSLEERQSAAAFVAVLGHSTALSGHRVSPINPRAIMLGQHVILAYQRGVQQVELIAYAHDRSRINLYLLSFEQACNRSAAGCSAGDLYTPRVESDWERVTLKDDEDLKNTPLDCRQCHQRGRESSMLLMRELESPWTHFLFASGVTDALPGVGGSELMDDYLRAKHDEIYGGLALHTISPESVFRLQFTVDRLQPLLFDAPKIEDERWPWSADSGYATEPQASPTWERGYEAFKRGEQLALPYLEARAVDRVKQARISEAYRRYRAGEISADELPDLANVFPDDPRLRARIGLATEPDATPVEALIQACGSCHNDVLDQTISRARFNIDLARLDRAELERAIERIQRPRSAPGAMPPPDARQLAPEARERLIAYLRQDPAEREDDPRLARAAELGMAGGAQP